LHEKVTWIGNRSFFGCLYSIDKWPKIFHIPSYYKKVPNTQILSFSYEEIWWDIIETAEKVTQNPIKERREL